MAILINKPHLCTKLEVWQPKYSAQYTDKYEEAVALLHKHKVDFGSPVIIVEFTKSKGLAGQRFAIRKQDAQQHEVGTNGKAPMYEIPMSHFQAWVKPEEINNIVINELGW